MPTEVVVNVQFKYTEHIDDCGRMMLLCEIVVEGETVDFQIIDPYDYEDEMGGMA